jgi:hypothetical protein
VGLAAVVHRRGELPLEVRAVKRTRYVGAETLGLTLFEMSQRIRALQKRVYVLTKQRDAWRERARAAERRVR